MATTTTTALEETAPAPVLLAPTQQNSSAENEAAAAMRRAIEERVAKAPLQLEIRLPIHGMRVKDVLGLRKGAVFETAWPADEDLPGDCAGVQLVWTEFEVIDKKLAVRVTRLA